MVYHKQASVASVMYKYLIRFFRVSAVPEEVHRWHSPAGLISASWDPACHVGRGTLVREESSASPLHLCSGGEWDRNGDQEEKWSPAVTFVLLFYFGILGYFTFGTTNLSLRYGSVLYWWSCKFKIARNCFPIIFSRLPSPKKESWLPYDEAGAGMRLMAYFTSLNHSLVPNIFGITAVFARFGWWNDGQAKILMKNVTSIAYLFDVSDVNFHKKSFI